MFSAFSSFVCSIMVFDLICASQFVRQESVASDVIEVGCVLSNNNFACKT